VKLSDAADDGQADAQPARSPRRRSSTSRTLLELTLDDAKGVSVMRLTLLDEFERKPIGASGLRSS
jgi:hypothetical protein